MSTTTTDEKDSMPRLKARYREEIVGKLRDEFEFGNVMQVPGLVKIVVNMGVGDAAKDSKLMDGALRDLATVTGQKPQVTKARKSIAQFKLREGMPIGCARHAARRPDVGVPRPLLSLALPAHPRLPRPLAPAVRRQGQLHVRPQRAVDVPRDRPGPDRPGPRHGHHGRDHGQTDDEGRALLRLLGFPFKEA
jgi:large subunit ribosomal protein L5